MVNELTLTTVRQAAPPAAISTPVSVEAQGAEIAARGKNEPSTKSSDSAASRADVLEAVHKMRDYMQIIDRDLHFSVDEDSGLTIVKVIDPSTDEVVRQIPCEEVMRVVRSLESGGGLLSDIKA